MLLNRGSHPSAASQIHKITAALRIIFLKPNINDCWRLAARAAETDKEHHCKVSNSGTGLASSSFTTLPIVSLTDTNPLHLNYHDRSIPSAYDERRDT